VPGLWTRLYWFLRQPARSVSVLALVLQILPAHENNDRDEANTESDDSRPQDVRRGGRKGRLGQRG
jgi:hypothetical protein